MSSMLPVFMFSKASKSANFFHGSRHRRAQMKFFSGKKFANRGHLGALRATFIKR